jgi:uncharacterized membrane protein YGL010W
MIRLIEKFVQAGNWLKIAASPAIVGIILGGLFYLFLKNMAGIVIGGLIALAGVIAGILLAKRISKRMGVIEFNGRVNASPDLDHLVDEQGKEHKNRTQ